MKKLLVVNSEKCSGCRTCENACSYFHEGEFNPALARLTVISWKKEGMDFPVICQQCETPLCKEVCPVNAIYLDENTSAWIINEEKCIGCKLCVNACPVGAMSFHSQKRMPFKCDLCKGEPQCVKRCVMDAIEYMELDKAIIQKKREHANKIAGIFNFTRAN